MKGVILAGGTGSRLAPLTLVTNKHLLPVYNKPMIYHPIEALRACGIKDILIVSGKGHAGHFLELLGQGRHMGVRLVYEVQEKALGVAHALALAEDFADGDSIAVMLGDNIFQDIAGLQRGVGRFKRQKQGAKIFVYSTEEMRRFGVAEVKNKKVVSIEEKPEKPRSNLAITGFYLFDHNVFGYIKRLKPSKRGEYEITDVQRAYLKRGILTYDMVHGGWSDSGTFDSLLRAGMIAAGFKEFSPAIRFLDNRMKKTVARLRREK